MKIKSFDEKKQATFDFCLLGLNISCKLYVRSSLLSKEWILELVQFSLPLLDFLCGLHLGVWTLGPLCLKALLDIIEHLHALSDSDLPLNSAIAQQQKAKNGNRDVLERLGSVPKW